MKKNISEYIPEREEKCLWHPATSPAPYMPVIHALFKQGAHPVTCTDDTPLETAIILLQSGIRDGNELQKQS